MRTEKKNMQLNILRLLEYHAESFALNAYFYDLNSPVFLTFILKCFRSKKFLVFSLFLLFLLLPDSWVNVQYSQDATNETIILCFIYRNVYIGVCCVNLDFFWTNDKITNDKITNDKIANELFQYLPHL